MIIRPSENSDLAAIDALLARAYPRLLKDAYPPSLLVTAIPIIARAQPKLVSSGTYYVAEVDGAIVGAGGWTPDGRDHTRGNVRHVVTDDRVVRQGIGRAIMAHTCDAAAAHGLDWLHCTATLLAVPFYEATGFSVIGPVAIPLAAGIDLPAVALRRNL